MCGRAVPFDDAVASLDLARSQWAICTTTTRAAYASSGSGHPQPSLLDAAAALDAVEKWLRTFDPAYADTVPPKHALALQQAAAGRGTGSASQPVERRKKPLTKHQLHPGNAMISGSIDIVFKKRYNYLREVKG